jgi:NAD(P)-dependent dehydrogenase (short-subunit alcohol dehydrogenase family)
MMHGKACVITGANTGIGKAAAESLAALGAHVVIICRNRAKGEIALADIRRGAANGGSAELVIADLSSQSEVRRAASDVVAAHPKIDVLINNAGVAPRRRELTVDGIERSFAVNYLAYFMLANLLLPAMRAAGRARIVNVASAAHGRGTLELDNLQGERRYRQYRMYASSKLEDVMLTYALARRLAGTGVTVNALHPGLVATEIWREVAILRIVGRWFMLSPEEGARTTVYLAASPDVENVTGTYFDSCQPARTSRASRDESLQEKLWTVSVALTGVGGDV